MIKNIENGKVLEIASLARIKEGIISSMSIIDDSVCNMKLFSVSKGESISAEKYSGDMIYLVIEGNMLLSIDGEEMLLHKGELVRVGENTEHDIKAVSSFKMIQLLVMK